MPSEDDADKDPPSPLVAKTVSSSETRLVEVPIAIAITSGTTTSFSLATTPINLYEIELADCASRYSSTITQADGALKVYRLDRGCHAKLNELTIGTTTYVPTHGDPFSTWEEGDLATFDEVGEPGTAPLKIIVAKTLGDPVQAADRIRYSVYDLKSGGNRRLLGVNIGGNGHWDNTGAAPSFSVRSIELKSLAPTGAGVYSIVLECNQAYENPNECNHVPFSQIDYKLVRNTFPLTGPTSADCDLAFAANGDSIDLSTDAILPGQAGTANGGFVTRELEGPGEISDFPHMVLMLRSYGVGGSYQYFELNADI